MCPTLDLLHEVLETVLYTTVIGQPLVTAVYEGICCNWETSHWSNDCSKLFVNFHRCHIHFRRAEVHCSCYLGRKRRRFITTYFVRKRPTKWALIWARSALSTEILWDLWQAMGIWHIHEITASMEFVDRRYSASAFYHDQLSRRKAIATYWSSSIKQIKSAFIKFPFASSWRFMLIYSQRISENFWKKCAQWENEEEKAGRKWRQVS